MTKNRNASAFLFSDRQQSPYFREEDRGFVMQSIGGAEEETISSGHNQPFNVLSSGGQETLFPHVLNSKHTGKA